jgi:hypothetical protein
MQFGSDVLILALFLFFVQEWLRRTSRITAWAVFFAIPGILTPFWIQGDSTPLCRQFDNPVFFCWLKLYSVSIAACWFTWLRFSPLKDRWWAHYVSLLILPLNIIEAIVQDVVSCQLHHYLNAAAGVLLVVTLPFAQKAFQVRVRNTCQDLDWEGVSRTWIAGYTIWNWVFIYHTFPVIAGQHLAVLGAAFVVGMCDPRRWLQARTYSLAIALFLLFTFPTFLVSRLGTVEWSNDRANIVCACVSLGFAATQAVAMASLRVRNLAHKPSRWSFFGHRIVSE